MSILPDRFIDCNIIPRKFQYVLKKNNRQANPKIYMEEQSNYNVEKQKTWMANTTLKKNKVERTTLPDFNLLQTKWISGIKDNSHNSSGTI